MTGLYLPRRHDLWTPRRIPNPRHDDGRDLIRVRPLIPATGGLLSRGGPPVTPTTGGDGGGGGGGGGGTTLGGAFRPSFSTNTYPTTGEVTTGDWYVDVNAAGGGDGSSGSPFDTLQEGLAAVSDGERIIVRSGTYNISSTITRSTDWPTGIEIFAYGDERPLIYGNGVGSNILSLSGSREHWKGFRFENPTGRVFLGSGSHHYTFEDVHATNCVYNTLYFFGAGCFNNVVQDTAVWKIGDGTTTGTNVPDCLRFTGGDGNLAHDNVAARCFLANGPDDCFDAYFGVDNSVLDSVAVGGGYYWNGTAAGDGSGWKLGGGSSGAGRATVRGCIGIGNKLHGFSYNFAPLPPDVQWCSTTDNVWVGFLISNPDSIMRNNISYQDANPKSNGSIDGTYNTWNDAADAGGNGDFPISNPLWVDKANWDLSLDTGSPCLGAATDGGNMGASQAALELAQEWIPALVTAGEIYIP